MLHLIVRDTPFAGGVATTIISDPLNLMDEEARGNKAYTEGGLAAVQERGTGRRP